MADLYHFRRLHLIVLGALLLGAIALVLVRGYSTRGGMLIWGAGSPLGRLAMLGKWQAYHGDPEAGMIFADIDYALPGGGPPDYVEFDYGAPDPDWDSQLGRANFTSWVSGGANAGVMIWISEEDNAGMVIRAQGRDGLPKIGHMVLLSAGYGN